MEITEEILYQHIEKAKEGNQISFNFLLHHFWSDVYKYQLKRTQNDNDAEDITIQSFYTETSKEQEAEAYKIADDSPTPEDKIITEQNLAKLLRDIKQLKPKYQEVIQLRYFQELTYKEISEQTKEPMNNVKVKLLRAKKLLAEIIKKS